MSASKIIDCLLNSANAARTDPCRKAQLLHLPGRGDLVVAGDLHNHQRNFERITHFADLAHHPSRIVILQELIHGGVLGPQGEDCSFDMLLAALNWAERFPGQVHLLLANHDLAQVQRLAVMKDGYDLTERFDRHIALRYGKDAPDIINAFRDFVFALPLAAITVNGLFLSHSLPAPRDLATFDSTILRRPLTEADYVRHGSVYQLIWGRNQSAEGLAKLSKTWWADVFICGHQGQDAGFRVIADKLLIIDSCHNHGVVLRTDLARPSTVPDLVNSLVPLASIV